MLIADELRQQEQILLDKSSLKEQAFYGFLAGKPLNYPIENRLTEIEQICLSVFCVNTPVTKDLTNMIKTQRRKQPIGGMHYTKNLIELSAMAKNDVELEKENLKSYCENNSARDFYILNHLFPNISSNLPPSEGSIDQIALYLYRGEFPQEGWKPLLLNALQEASDLMDVYVIERGYQQAMDDHPIVHQVEAILYVRDRLARLIEKTERRVKFTIGGVGVLLLGVFGVWLVPLIVRNWDEAEAIIAIIEIFAFLIGVLIVGLIGFIPEKIKIFNRFREKVIDWVFRIKGFNRSELKEKLDRLK